MKQISTPLLGRGIAHFLIWATLCLSLAFSTHVSAQITSAACNTSTTVTTTSFANLSVTSSQFATVDEFAFKARLIDNDITTATTYLSAVGSSAWVEVKDLNATGGNVYPAGTFAGFIINSTSVAGAITISTYLGTGTTPIDSKTFSNLANVGLLSASTRLGINTTGAFDRIRIEYGGVVGTIRVFAPVIQRFCGPSPALTCNVPNVPAAPAAPVYVDPDNTGLVGTATVGSILNPDAAVSASTIDYASINLTAGVGTIGTFAIKNAVTSYTATASNPAFVGLDLSSTGLLTLSALSSLTVSTYLNGLPTGQSATGNNLVSANVPILLGNGRGTIGFLTTTAFDEVKLRVASVLSTQEIRVFGAVIEPFCAGPSLDCADNTILKNTITPLVNPTSPVYVNSVNTEIRGVVTAGYINDSGNIIDADLTNYASISLTAGVASTASVGVANALDTYPVNSFAGFDIATNSLLSVNAASVAVVSLYNNGSLVQTSLNNGLIVGASSSPLLNGRSRQYVGVIANFPYDEVKISFINLASADLGEIRVYNAVFEKTCAAVIVCNTAYNLSNPTFPVVIDNARTGVTGAVSAATTVENPWNVVSSDITDFARINTTASVASRSSIAVVDPISTYPVGTFAGFAVQKVTGIAALDLFANLTIATYNDGVFQESRSGVGLLDLAINLFGTTSQFFNAGFVTTKPFDEVQITVRPLAGVAALSALGGSLNVYGAFIDTRTTTGGGLVCALNTNPDFAVTNKNVPVTGSVKTNDIVPVGTTYGPAPTSTTQPAGSTPSLTVNSDGTYTFVSSTPGVYVYSVPVCGSGLSGTGCATQTLTITVLDPTVNNNNPVANPDVASTIGNDISPSPITINVRVNDGPGNPGGTLGIPTIAIGPANGTATVNGSGNVVYTPAAGFYGTDKFVYTVCETPGTSLCASSTVTITVSASSSPNTTLAADDYISTYQSTSVAGNVKTNDTDPEGNTQTITAQNTLIPGKGTLVLATDGTYTFTPVAGATGPVDFSYTTTDNGSPSASASATLHILINPLNLLTTNPDFNVTNKNVPATGSVKTNDIVPVGTTYGPAPTSSTQPAGSSPSLTVASDGSYTFVSATPGVYVYSIPVCASGLSGTGCATQTLTITVLDPTVNTNNPVANPDVASMLGNPTTPASITVNIKANDRPGNPGGTLGVPTIASGPANGTATVDGSGNVVYTPAAGFYGTDKFTYTVCETPGTSLCASSTVTISVKAPGSPNTTLAADDYISTYQSTSVTGNVKTNDTDPEGNTQTIAAQNTLIPGKGTLVLATDGTYTFTPVAGATGPVDFSYTTTDNGSPVVSASGTLHILINPFNPNPDFAVTNINVPVPGSVKTNDVVPIGTTYGPTPTLTSSPGGSTPTLVFTSTGSYTFTASTPGVYTYSVPVCVTGTPPVCTTQTLTITVSNPSSTTNNPVANPDFATTTGAPGSPTAITVNVKINDGPGNTGGALQNPTIPAQPANGTATIDGSGNLVYTPAAGFYGIDIVTYSICETPSTPSCATATVTITVKAPNSPAIVSANDDYISTRGEIPASGSVLNNDIGTGLSVSNTGTTVTSSGTLVLAASGSYTFTAAPGATGPVDFTYTACDNNTPSACASATLHVLVNLGIPDLTPTIVLPQANFSANSVRNLVVNVQELTGQTTSSGTVSITIFVPSGYSISYSNAISSIDLNGSTTNVDNMKWSISASNSTQITLTINPGQAISGNTTAVLGFSLTRTTANTGSISNITVNVTNDPTKTYDGNPLNNVYARIITGI